MRERAPACHRKLSAVHRSRSTHRCGLFDRCRQFERPHPRPVANDGQESVWAHAIPGIDRHHGPVMLWAPSLRRNSTAFATSSIAARWPSHCAARLLPLCLVESLRHVVRGSLGDPFSSPLAPDSRASERVKPSIGPPPPWWRRRRQTAVAVKPMIDACSQCVLRHRPSMKRTTYLLRTMGQRVQVRTKLFDRALWHDRQGPMTLTAALLTRP